MTLDWRTLSADELERQFNPRVAVADVQAYLDGYTARAAATRKTLAGEYDLRYGERPKQTLDLHRPLSTAASPLLLFIHGGFWRALDKSDHTWVAPLFVEAGIAVANINYDLCPSVTLDVIVQELREALRYCYHHADEFGADANRIYLSGHSAGAHLAAMLLAEDWAAAGLPADVIQGAILLSGIYEPEAVRHISVNNDVRLTPDIAERNNTLERPPRRQARIVVPVGGDEPEHWRQQSVSYVETCRAAGITAELMIVPGTNHFTVLENAVTPGTELAKEIRMLSGLL